MWRSWCQSMMAFCGRHSPIDIRCIAISVMPWKWTNAAAITSTWNIWWLWNWTDTSHTFSISMDLKGSDQFKRRSRSNSMLCLFETYILYCKFFMQEIIFTYIRSKGLKYHNFQAKSRWVANEHWCWGFRRNFNI